MARLPLVQMHVACVSRCVVFARLGTVAQNEHICTVAFESETNIVMTESHCISLDIIHTAHRGGKVTGFIVVDAADVCCHHVIFERIPG